MKLWVVYKVRKEQDRYQSHTWRLVVAGNNEGKMEAERDSLINRLSSNEVKVGWTYEITTVEADIDDAKN